MERETAVQSRKGDRGGDVFYVLNKHCGQSGQQCPFWILKWRHGRQSFLPSAPAQLAPVDEHVKETESIQGNI